MMPYKDFKTIYDIAYSEAPGLSKGLFFKREINILDYDTTEMFLINHDRSEFIDISEYIHSSSVQDEDDKYPWCLSPLPLLTACGNGRRGGDFGEAYIGSENVGTWAFQWVEYTDKILEGYAKANYRWDFPSLEDDP